MFTKFDVVQILLSLRDEGVFETEDLDTIVLTHIGNTAIRSSSHSQWVQLVRSDFHSLGEDTTADAIICTR